MEDNIFIGKKLKKSKFFYFDEKSKKIVPSLHNKESYELKRNITLTKYNRLFKIKDKIASHGFYT